MAKFLKVTAGVPRAGFVNGTDIASGAGTATQFLAADGSGNSAFRSLASGDLPTITFTGNVTGSASGGSIATTIASNVVTNSMLAQANATSVLGNSGGSPANVSYLTLASAATVSSVMYRDTNANVQVNSLVRNFTSTTTAAGTTTLTVSSSTIQIFTGSTTQTLQLPNATTLSNGTTYRVINQSTGAVAVNNNGASLIVSVPGGTTAFILLTSNGTANGTWDSTNTFGSAITALTGDVVASGPGSASSNIQANVVSNAKLAQMPANTFKGNNSGSSSNAIDLTVAQALTLLGIRAGVTSLSSGTTSKAITFSTAFASTAYAVTAVMLNTTDTNPQFIPVTITAQSTGGFTAKWNLATDTANYSLSWYAILNN
jgi:hypothetical protein